MSASLHVPVSTPMWDIKVEKAAGSSWTASSRWFTKWPMVKPTQGYWGTSAHFYFVKIPKTNDLRNRSIQDSRRLLCPWSQGQSYSLKGTTYALPIGHSSMILSYKYDIQTVSESYFKMCELFLEEKKGEISGCTQKNKKKSSGC